jgi:hypothetical protein
VQSRNNARARASKVVRQLTLLVGAGVVVAAVAESAAAASGWSVQPVPRPAHSGDTELSGVSCTSSRDCMAVGQSVQPSTVEPIPLVEHWNGSSWSIQRTPIQTASGWAGSLSGVSCTSSGVCVAVGSSWSNAEGMGPLAERWNGSAWSIQRTPRPWDAQMLDGVSCTSSRACIAVGNGQESFAERWDGNRWSVENVRFGDPLGRANALMGVSCPSSDACAAVGWDDIGLCADEYESDYVAPVLGFWQSGRWSLRRNPGLRCSSGEDNGGGNWLNAVSCTSPTACTAVGSEVAWWDGRRWSAQSAPIAIHALSAVSCTSKDACTAVGSDIDTWNGRQWSSLPVPRPGPNEIGALSGVSCTSQASCVAVGNYAHKAGEYHPLIESEG